METKGVIKSKSVIERSSYLADSGAANAYAVTLVPAATAYEEGMRIRFKATNANTGAATLNINGLGAKSIFKSVDTALTAGDILAGQIIECTYDGVNFQIQSGAGTSGNDPLVTVEISGTSHTLELANAFVILKTLNAAATTITVPTNASVGFELGTVIYIEQWGTGQVTVAPAGGVTINGAGTKIAEQYAGAYLRKDATNTWILVGNITT